MARPLNADAVQHICAHMNEDHADALVSYARVFARLDDVRSARMTGLDATGLDLDVATGAGSLPARITFDHTLEDADDAHQTLIRMARAT